MWGKISMEDVAQLRAMKAESSQTEVEGRLVKGCSITCDVLSCQCGSERKSNLHGSTCSLQTA